MSFRRTMKLLAVVTVIFTVICHSHGFGCETTNFEGAIDLLKENMCRGLEIDHIKFVNEQDFKDFCAALKENDAVKFLEIEDVALTADHLIDLTDALTHRRSSLVTLELVNVGLDDQSVSQIVQLLMAEVGMNLRKLDLSRNKLTDEGADHMMRALGGTNIVDLDLSNNDLGERAMQIFTEVVGSTRLREVDLNGNRRIGSDAIVNFVENIGNSPSSHFNELEVKGCGLTPEGARRIRQLQTTISHHVKVEFEKSLLRRPLNKVGAQRKSPAYFWNESEVSTWLTKLHESFSQYVVAFHEHAISGEVLMQLTDSDLVDIVPNSLHRKRILAEIAKLNTYDEL